LETNKEISLSAKGGHMDDLTNEQVIREIRRHYRSEKKAHGETLKTLADKIGVNYVILHHTITHKFASQAALEKYREFIKNQNVGEIQP
jgi:hypothetical protein